MDIVINDLAAEMSLDAIVIAHLKDDNIALEFYSALCNMRWKKISVMTEDLRIVEKLKGIDSRSWSCGWRAAGGIIADIRNTYYNTKEDYMHFYCSGNEGDVSGLVEECFYRMGWERSPWEDVNDF